MRGFRFRDLLPPILLCYLRPLLVPFLWEVPLRGLLFLVCSPRFATLLLNLLCCWCWLLLFGVGFVVVYRPLFCLWVAKVCGAVLFVCRMMRFAFPLVWLTCLALSLPTLACASGLGALFLLYMFFLLPDIPRRPRTTVGVHIPGCVCNDMSSHISRAFLGTYPRTCRYCAHIR